MLRWVCVIVLLSLELVSSDAGLERREEQIVGRLLSLGANDTKGAPQVKKVFNCQVIPPSKTVPRSVHKLRPGDIKVIAALGDSLTAARGASGTVVGLLVDYRGLSWSIGGDDCYEAIGTLPNVLRKYNPDLYGFSQGVGSRDKASSRFNVARTGDESQHMVEQAKLLVERMKSDPNIDFENDWKLVTFFIGGNDLCDYCTDKAEYTADKYRSNIVAALDILQANLPRTFVNLVEVLNIEITEDLAHNLLCKAVHIYACNCAANPKTQADRDYVLRLKDAYQQAAVDIATSGRYDTKDDFTVVLQPFYRETFLPRTPDGNVDYSYFAQDCFHHSAKGQRAAAEALWNNMVEPVGKKRIQWTPDEPIECPTEEHPYLYTNKNSL